MIKNIDGIIATGETIAMRFKKKENILVSYNGIFTDKFLPDINKKEIIRKKLNIPENYKVFCIASSLTKQKGVYIAVNAFNIVEKIYKKVFLLIIGDDPEKEKINFLIKKLNLSKKTKFVGYVEYQEVSDYLNACDIFLHPSLRIEGLPTIIIEALSCAKPVIATDTGATKDIFKCNQCGFLIRKRDLKSLVKAMLELLNNDELYILISKNARKCVEENFNIKDLTSNLLLQIKNIYGI